VNEQPTEPSDKEIGAEDIGVSDAAAKSVVGGGSSKRNEKSSESWATTLQNIDPPPTK
jgi:hypothetical protein